MKVSSNEDVALRTEQGVKDLLIDTGSARYAF